MLGFDRFSCKVLHANEYLFKLKGDIKRTDILD